jgi:hypothetical protein
VASNRRLVPMPTRRRHEPLFSVARNSPELLPPSEPPGPTVPPPLQVQQPWLQPGAKLGPSTLKEDAPYILAFLTLAALWWWAKPLFEVALLISAFLLMIHGWYKLSNRFPKTMYFINVMLLVLMGGRGRRH